MLFANQAPEREREARRCLLDKDHDPRTSESEDESNRPLEPYINIWPDSDDSDPDDRQRRVIMNNVRYNRRRAKRRQCQLAKEKARACDPADRAPTAAPSDGDGLVTTPRQPANKRDAANDTPDSQPAHDLAIRLAAMASYAKRFLRFSH
eukprot:1117622-Pleurochrysis_carterae.AAC.1